MDMVTMNIIDSSMVSICREMGITLMKTSYSTIFNEGLATSPAPSQTPTARWSRSPSSAPPRSAGCRS